MPSLSDIKTEYELYTYLKDGTELCRMIGFLTTGQVLAGITYGPNNISTLEEKNISLFLGHVEKELGLQNLFGRENGSQVLHKFSNFHIVLSGLGKVSEKIHKKSSGIHSFSTTGKPTVVGYKEKHKDDEYKNNEIHDHKDSEEFENWQILVKEEKSLTNLDCAVREMINFNDRFISDVLRPLESFEAKNTSHVLGKQFFPVFQVGKLLELHRKLKHDFEKLPYEYTLIGPTFEGLKKEWLVYCQIATKAKNAIDLYADQVSANTDVQKMIEEVERKAERAAKESNNFHSIKDLVQMITSYALRWPVLLESIIKKARKESYKKKVEQSAQRAFHMMTAVFKHMEQVTKDYYDCQAMENFAKEVNNLPINLEFNQFGKLKKELSGIDFSKGTTGSGLQTEIL